MTNLRNCNFKADIISPENSVAHIALKVDASVILVDGVHVPRPDLQPENMTKYSDHLKSEKILNPEFLKIIFQLSTKVFISLTLYLTSWVARPP